MSTQDSEFPTLAEWNEQDPVLDRLHPELKHMRLTQADRDRVNRLLSEADSEWPCDQVDYAERFALRVADAVLGLPQEHEPTEVNGRVVAVSPTGTIWRKDDLAACLKCVLRANPIRVAQVDAVIERMLEAKWLHIDPVNGARLTAAGQEALRGKGTQPGGDVTPAPANVPPGESLLTTWRTIARVFNQSAELPLTIKQLRLANEDGGPVKTQKGRGKRPSVSKTKLLAWRDKLLSGIPVTSDNDAHVTDAKEVLFRREDQIGQTRRNMRSTGRRQRKPKNAID